MLLSVRGSGRYGSTVNANYTLSHCYGSPDGGGGGTTNVSVGLQHARAIPRFDDGNCTADRLHNFSMTACDSVAAVRERAACARRSRTGGWSGSFRALTGPWLTITTGVDQRAERPGRHAARQSDSDDVYARPVDQPGERRHPVPEPGRVRAAGGRHARHVAAQQHPGSGQQEHRSGAVAGLPDRQRSRASRSAPRRSTPSTGSSWAQPATARNSATFGQITSIGQCDFSARPAVRGEVRVLGQLSAVGYQLIGCQLSALGWTRSALN